jgi:hypothetical protein
MVEQCEGHDRMVVSVESIALASVRSEERFQGFLRFAKWVGGVTLTTLGVIAWVGISLLGRIEKMSDAYQLADLQLIMKAAENKQEIAVNREGMRRVEADLSYIRKQLEKAETRNGH